MCEKRKNVVPARLRLSLTEVNVANTCADKNKMQLRGTDMGLCTASGSLNDVVVDSRGQRWTTSESDSEKIHTIQSENNSNNESETV